MALVVIASNSLSGINAILFYAKQLFNKITDGDLAQAQLLIVIMSGVQVCATFISSRIVDRLGRKDLIITGQAILLGILLAIFIFDKVIREYVDASVSNYGIIGLIFTHLLVMNMTLGPCCVVYCAEIVADITWMIILLKGLALLIALTTEYLIEYVGIGFMFLIFFGLGLCAHIFLRPRVR